MRLSSDFWVSAYLRRCQTDGDFAALTRRGASQGGAIFIIVNRLDGTADLYGPAPQALLDGDERAFHALVSAGEEDLIRQRLEKEARFDPDLWIIERESTAGRHDLTLVE
ncbi:MAG: DUF1491 family protein [Pseudomonadota bacterium]